MPDPIHQAINRILKLVEVEEHPYEFIESITLLTCRQRIELMRPSPEEIEEEGEDTLGEYHPMTSPGRIVLYWDRIGSFFWHHMLRLVNARFYIAPEDLKVLAEMTVAKTYAHQQFHHFADVARQLFGGKYDRDVEEALAVAFSHRHLCERWLMRGPARLRPVLRELITRMFSYRSPGYRDWHLYRTDNDFATGLVSYLGPKSSVILEQNGIDVAGILLAIEPTIRDLGVNTVILP